MVLCLTLAGFALAGGADDEHGGHESHAPFNMWEGLGFESADAEPGLLARKPGTQPPYGAMLLNSGLLFLILFLVGGPKLKTALKARKSELMKGMADAAAMRKEAEARLREFEAKLESIDADIESAKRQIRESGEAERERVLKDARDKRERMERDAKQMIAQELKAMRQELHLEVVRNAMAQAREVLANQVTQTDQQRLQNEYIARLRSTSLGRSS